MAKKLKVTLVHSGAGRHPRQRATLKGLGLKRLERTVVVDDTPSFRGMIDAVRHLVKVEEAEG